MSPAGSAWPIRSRWALIHSVVFTRAGHSTGTSVMDCLPSLIGVVIGQRRWGPFTGRRSLRSMRAGAGDQYRTGGEEPGGGHRDQDHRRRGQHTDPEHQRGPGHRTQRQADHPRRHRHDPGHAHPPDPVAGTHRGRAGRGCGGPPGWSVPWVARHWTRGSFSAPRRGSSRPPVRASATPAMSVVDRRLSGRGFGMRSGGGWRGERVVISGNHPVDVLGASPA